MAGQFKFYDFSQHGYDDILQVKPLTLDTFLENLRIRYNHGIYYTYIGEVCISINPNRTNVDIYGPDYMEKYLCKPLYSVPPHIFAIADAAFQETFNNNRNSCILITGESGSGKTEASKLILLYITNVLRMQEMFPQNKITTIEDVILHSSCILEAFGNARTLRNNNSSRFGKYIEIYFSREQSASLVGNNYPSEVQGQFSYGIIHNFLLEKSRVIEQQHGERNFHIFYQLLSSFESITDCHLKDTFESLDLISDVHAFEYLRHNGQSSLAYHDKANFFAVLDALDKVGFTIKHVKIICRILAAILHLGNVQFKDGMEDQQQPLADFQQYLDSHSVVSLQNVSRLLSIDFQEAWKTLCSRRITTRYDVLVKMYTREEAIFGRDALAKILYHRLFNFIVDRINQTMQKDKPGDYVLSMTPVSAIGILDIYGFEVFNTHPNGFEQFLINYCNEKLHQLFVDTILRKEQELYSKEDIDWHMVEFENNLAICKLMDEPHEGIFAVLDEVCVSGHACTNSMLLNAFNIKFESNPHYQSRITDPSLKQLKAETDFIIRHYAGDVHYSLEGFMDKNMDQLYFDYRKLIYSSSDYLIKDIMCVDIEQNEELSRKRPVTAAFEFRRSMTDLMSRLASNQQFYVRCIKPNEYLYDNRFDPDKVRHQIRYLGLVENALVRKAGFWRQMPYKHFVQRYHMLGMKDFDRNSQCDYKDQRKHFMPLCESILKESLIDHGDAFDLEEMNTKLAFGKTMIFLRDPGLIESLERRRLQNLTTIVNEMQAFGKGFLARKRFERLKLSRKLFQLYCQIRCHEVMSDLLRQLEIYDNQNIVLKADTPAHLFEYHHLQQFQWPFELIAKSICLEQDPVFTRIMPELIRYLTDFLIVFNFSAQYWNEKFLRIDAFELFRKSKQEWGQNRHRWAGNYLADEVECTDADQYNRLISQYMVKHKSDSLLFSSYIVKTNQHSLDHIYGLAVTNNHIVKVDFDSNTVTRLVDIRDIGSISVTPGVDQLVAIHTNKADDLVFAFCTLKETARAITSSDTPTVDPPELHCARVGELVTLLCKQYHKLTKANLQLQFSQVIIFHLNQVEYMLEVVDSLNSTGGGFKRMVASMKKFFTVKHMHHVYLAMLNLRHRINNERLTKRVEFQKVSKRHFVLIYE